MGKNGCTAIDSVEVLINAVPDIPDLQASQLNACENDELTLTTQQYTGNNVAYYWYSGTFPGGTIIDTTQLSKFTDSSSAIYSKLLCDG